MAYALAIMLLAGCDAAPTTAEKVADIDTKIRLIQGEWIRERAECQAIASDTGSSQAGADCLRDLAAMIEIDKQLIAAFLRRRNAILAGDDSE